MFSEADHQAITYKDSLYCFAVSFNFYGFSFLKKTLYFFNTLNVVLLTSHFLHVIIWLFLSCRSNKIMVLVKLSKSNDEEIIGVDLGLGIFLHIIKS